MRAVHRDEYEAVKCCAKCATKCAPKCPCFCWGKPCWRKLLLIFNAIIAVIALALIGVLAWQLKVNENPVIIDGFWQAGIVICAFIFAVASLGLGGAVSSRSAIDKGTTSCPMLVYYLLLLIFFISELIIAVYILVVLGYVKLAAAEDIASIGTSEVDKLAMMYINANPNNWVAIQNALECCGYTSVADTTATGASCSNLTPDTCRSSLLSDIEDKGAIVGSIGIVLAVVMIVCLIAANCVMCCMKQRVADDNSSPVARSPTLADVAEQAGYRRSKWRIFLLVVNSVMLISALLLVAHIGYRMNTKTNPIVSPPLFATAICIAAFIGLVALLGILGAEFSIKRGTSRTMVVYFVLLVVFLIAELVVSALVLTLLGYVSNARAESVAATSTAYLDRLVRAFANARPTDWISLQNLLECCGYDDPSDPDYGTGSLCPTGVACRTHILDEVELQGRVIGGFGVGLVVITLLCVVAGSYVLCCMQRRKNSVHQTPGQQVIRVNRQADAVEPFL